MSGVALAAEAFALGLSSGPVCLASCSPVLVPVLAAEGENARGSVFLLARFLAGRLAGYLAFACVAWLLGLSLELHPRSRMTVIGCSDAGLAILLAGYGMAIRGPSREGCSAPCSALRPRPFGQRYRSFAPLFLGFASGLALCPPFLAAGVRAAETGGLLPALGFFLCFFVGTSVWFAPSLSLSLARRFPAVRAVARLTLFVLAVYYAYAATIILGRVFSNG